MVFVVFFLQTFYIPSYKDEMKNQYLTENLLVKHHIRFSSVLLLQDLEATEKWFSGKIVFERKSSCLPVTSFYNVESRLMFIYFLCAILFDFCRSKK